MILEFSGVCFSYRSGKKGVLDNFSMEIEESAIYAVLGPNGAGKSTLLDLCLGWKQAQRGSVILRGRAMSSYSRRETGSCISLVPQDEQISFEYTVLEYTLLGRAPYLGQLDQPGELDLMLARAALEKTGISHLENRQVTKLSGGEHQLLMISRALCQDPDLILMDEPTSKLDPANRSRVVQIIEGLASEGVSVLFTTHDPALAAGLASHMILLKEGRSLASGRAEEVLTGENLSALYEIPMEVHRIDGRPVVLPLSPLPQR